MKSSIFLFFAIALMTTACQKEALDFPRPNPKNVIYSEVSDRYPHLGSSNNLGYEDYPWPSCATELPAAMARLQALANETCRPQYCSLHCEDKDGNQVHYLLFAECVE